MHIAYRRAGFVVVLAAVILVALHHFYNSRTPPVAASFPVPTVAPVQIVNVSPQCPGEIETIFVGQTPVVINPGSRCIVKWGVNGPLKLIDHSGASITVGPAGGSYDSFWTESVQAVGPQEVTLHYKLVLP
jgi:hypothetical protein